MNNRIHDLLPNEKPREKIYANAESATETELLAAILSTGGKDISSVSLARELLYRFGTLPNLILADVKELEQIKFVGKAKACAIRAVGEIYRRNQSATLPLPRPTLTKPADIFELLKTDFYGKEKETLIVISIDSRNKLISKDVVTVGILSETLVHPREIFKIALKKNAYAVFLAHNHPSDDPTPSSEDISASARACRAGVEIGIPVYDHVICGKHSFSSLKSMGLLAKSS